MRRGIAPWATDEDLGGIARSREQSSVSIRSDGDWPNPPSPLTPSPLPSKPDGSEHSPKCVSSPSHRERRSPHPRPGVPAECSHSDGLAHTHGTRQRAILIDRPPAPKCRKTTLCRAFCHVRTGPTHRRRAVPHVPPGAPFAVSVGTPFAVSGVETPLRKVAR
jgi:hypothetical protein